MRNFLNLTGNSTFQYTKTLQSANIDTEFKAKISLC